MTATVTFTPSPAPSGIYDTSIGLGVIGGFADLTKHASDRYIYVGNGGSDAANGLTHANRLATVAAAYALVTSGQGDQILVAEGSAFSADLGTSNGFRSKSGRSAAYPIVLQSYNTSDPTNAALFGKATTNRPVFSATSHTLLFDGVQYLAWRGLKFDAGNVADSGVSLNYDLSYFLLENCIFAYKGYGFNCVNPTTNQGHIIRRCSVYGGWSASTHVQGFYINTGDNSSHTVEDCIVYHTGWKIGASREDTTTNGGPGTFYRHGVYSAPGTTATLRRNLLLDIAVTGLSPRGNQTVYENLAIKCPIAYNLGLNPDETSHHPSGISIQAYNNAAFIDNDVSTAVVRGWAFNTGAGASGSRIHHNLIAKARNTANNNGNAFRTEGNNSTGAGPTLDSYMLWDYNRAKSWDTVSSHTEWGSNTALCHATFSNNVSDVLLTGSGNSTSFGSMPNQYASVDALAAALGYTDEATWIAAMKDRPDLSWAANARTTLGTGYGMTWA